MLLHYSCVNITIRYRWSINRKMRFCTLLTVKGWSSTLPTATAALSSNVFVAPVSTWWSFILFSLHSSFILQLTTINSEVLHPVGRHICLDLLRKQMAVYGSYMTYLSKMSTSTEVVFVVAVADSDIFSQRFILSKFIMADEEDGEFFRLFADVPLNPPEKRDMCDRCK